jgi:uncharacterized DUF497 family protein
MGGGHEQEFEWDADKAEANLRKHRIAFEAARRVFEDDFAVECPMSTCLTVKCGS